MVIRYLGFNILWNSLFAKQIKPIILVPRESIQDSFEYKTNLDGFPGAKTSTGVSRAEDRTPDTDWDDMGDSVSFAELLDMLGIEDEEGF